MIKVRFTTWWDNDYNLKNRIINSFITDENRDDNIQLVTDNNYDYLIYLGYSNHGVSAAKERSLGITMEPTKTWEKDRMAGYNDYDLYKKCKYVFVHDKELFGGNREEFVVSPSMMIYHMDFRKHTINWHLKNMNFNKSKKVSMIIRYRTPRKPGDGILCEQRTKLAIEIIKNKIPVDIYGKDWNKSGLISRHIKGPIDDKFEGLIDYQFSINSENTIEQNYITEKMFDSFLTNVVPVYYGATNAGNIYNPDSFVTYDLLNMDKALETIEGLFKLNYMDYRDLIIESKRRYFEKYNIYNVVKDFVYGVNLKEKYTKK